MANSVDLTTLPLQMWSCILEDACQKPEDYRRIRLVCRLFRDILLNLPDSAIEEAVKKFYPMARRSKINFSGPFKRSNDWWTFGVQVAAKWRNLFAKGELSVIKVDKTSRMSNFDGLGRGMLVGRDDELAFVSVANNWFKIIKKFPQNTNPDMTLLCLANYQGWGYILRATKLERYDLANGELLNAWELPYKLEKFDRFYSHLEFRGDFGYILTSDHITRFDPVDFEKKITFNANDDPSPFSHVKNYWWGKDNSLFVFGYSAKFFRRLSPQDEKFKAFTSLPQAVSDIIHMQQYGKDEIVVLNWDIERIQLKAYFISYSDKLIRERICPLPALTVEHRGLIPFSIDDKTILLFNPKVNEKQLLIWDLEANKVEKLDLGLKQKEAVLEVEAIEQNKMVFLLWKQNPEGSDLVLMFYDFKTEMKKEKVLVQNNQGQWPYFLWDKVNFWNPGSPGSNHGLKVLGSASHEKTYLIRYLDSIFSVPRPIDEKNFAIEKLALMRPNHFI